jgi:hypothetical protein
MAISSELETYLNDWEPAWILGFCELHTAVNCAIGFTYKYFSAYPGCVIGGGTWTGWTGCMALWIFYMHVAAV